MLFKLHVGFTFLTFVGGELCEQAGTFVLLALGLCGLSPECTDHSLKQSGIEKHLLQLYPVS